MVLARAKLAEAAGNSGKRIVRHGVRLVRAVHEGVSQLSDALHARADACAGDQQAAVGLTLQRVHL